jgi:hypothetical protein
LAAKQERPGVLLYSIQGVVESEGSPASATWWTGAEIAPLAKRLASAANRHVLRRRFHTACRILGWDRLRTQTIHHGRHTSISHALAG